MASRQEVILGSAARLRRRAVSERRWANASLYIGVAILVLVGLAAIFAPLIAPYPPNAQDLVNAFQPPSGDHLMGTDNLGRDIFSRVVYAARVDLQIGFITTYVPLVYGVILGAIAGYFGGWVDSLIMRLTDIMLSVPGLLLAIGLVAALGQGLWQIMIAVGVTQIPIFARLLRGSILATRESDYVLAARSVGVPSRSILASHILPNSISPVIVQGTLALATAIIDVAGLGFLGLGPQDPATPEWGTMLTDTTRYLQTAPHLALIPGVAIVISVLGFNLIGDGLREALDPRFRGRA
jgi:peptide/nickel transport system permease protein